MRNASIFEYISYKYGKIKKIVFTVVQISHIALTTENIMQKFCVLPF